MSAHSAGTYTATLLVMVNVVKGGGRAPPPSPAWANFTLMIECTPESSRCYSVYSVGDTLLAKALAANTYDIRTVHCTGTGTPHNPV